MALLNPRQLSWLWCFYFRPDDYPRCWEQLGECDVRPWVIVGSGIGDTNSYEGGCGSEIPMMISRFRFNISSS